MKFFKSICRLLLAWFLVGTSFCIAQPQSSLQSDAEDAHQTTVPILSDLMVGKIRLIGGYTQVKTGTKDSQQGEIRRAKGNFVINYDIGFSAGMHMEPGRRPACLWFKQQQIHGLTVYIGLVQSGSGRELIVTIDGPVKNDWQFPANFVSHVRNEEDIADTLLIALSYEPNAQP